MSNLFTASLRLTAGIEIPTREVSFGHNEPAKKSSVQTGNNAAFLSFEIASIFIISTIISYQKRFSPTIQFQPLRVTHERLRKN